MGENAAPATVMPRLTLRLDDGTIIRASKDAKEAQVLKPAEAWEAGLLDESHLLRMQALLCELHSKLPEEGPLKSISLGSKRSFDSVLEVNQQPSANKRQRSEGAPPVASAAPAAAAAANGGPAAIAPPADYDWFKIASRVVDYLLDKVLADDKVKAIFIPPVPESVKDYHEIIARPVCFSEIKSKLATRQYSSPKECYDDVVLLCDNCFRFNVQKYRSEVGDTGVRMENAFLQAWAKTPMAAVAPPRPLRIVPPPFRAQSRAQPPKKPNQNGVGRGAGRGPGGGRGRPGRPPGAVARTKSATSYGAAIQMTYTAEMQDALVSALNDPTVLEANMEGVVKILNDANEMGMDEDGEATLDLEKVTPPTALKLYDLVVVRTGRAPVPAAPAAAGVAGAYRPMQRDDDDWDPDDEDED